MEAIKQSMPAGLPAAHPAAELFPMMGDGELQQLADDIRANGQKQPIVMLKGKILDGRNRFIACVMACKKPWVVQWQGDGSPIAFVISANLHRRHLTAAQKAAVAAEALPMFEAEARARMAAGGGDKTSDTARAGRVDSSLPARQQDEQKRAVAQAAKAVGAGVSATKAMAAVKKKAPEVFALAKENKVSVEEAKRIAALLDEERTEAVDEAKQRPRRPARKPQPNRDQVANLSAPSKACAAALAAALRLSPEEMRWLCDALLARLAPRDVEPHSGAMPS